MRNIVQSSLSPGQVVYDVGANVGYHALMFAHYVGPHGHVVAFEPNPIDGAILRWNVTVNRATNVKVVESAVSDASGTVSFATFDEPGIHRIAGTNEPTDAKFITVTSVTLDEWVYTNGEMAPSLVKIDVEGGEYRVLRGAAKVLHEHRPVVVVEVWPQTSEALRQFMKDCNYLVKEEHKIGASGLTDTVFVPVT